MTIGERIGKGIDTLVRACEGVGEDVSQFLEDKSHDFCETMDKVMDGTYDGIGKTVVDNVKSGYENARTAVRDQVTGYKKRMDKDVKTNEGVGRVGFWDGFVEAYTGSKIDRRPGSQVYETHRKYGKAVGYASAAVLFLKGRTVGKVVGSLPVATRVGRYFVRKINEAKAATEKGQAKA